MELALRGKSYVSKKGMKGSSLKSGVELALRGKYFWQEGR